MREELYCKCKVLYIDWKAANICTLLDPPSSANKTPGDKPESGRTKFRYRLIDLEDALTSEYPQLGNLDGFPAGWNVIRDTLY